MIMNLDGLCLHEFLGLFSLFKRQLLLRQAEPWRRSSLLSVVCSLLAHHARGLPPIGGAKPPLSFHSIIRPLPVIEEDTASHDDDAPPKVPEKSPDRQVSPLTAAAAAAAAARARAPRVTATPPPPPIRSLLPLRGATSGNGGGGGRSAAAAQEPEKDDHSLKSWLSKRGGWYRATLMAALAVCAIVALTRGSRQCFSPAGSYAFRTALYNVKKDCTSNNNTFRCYPFKTYSQSRSDASATYFWTISQVNSWAFQISAAPNPFVPQFTNLSLTQLDANQFSERLTFSFSMHGAAVVPTMALGEDNKNNHKNNSSSDSDRAATCYYNDTLVTGTIWTRRPAEFPANLTTPVSNGGRTGKPITSSTTFDPWPYAVQVVQSTRDAPDCRDADGNRVGGDFSRPPDRSGECSCSYANFGL
ncbi:hypothetical protein PG994_007898 [Apiospora phragmitis]|uniref:Uncharacterized protein n=1 Tax=Apiospora phragmitis TaxID=2905665 RepID=A0ABR1URH5_9PEZI